MNLCRSETFFCSGLCTPHLILEVIVGKLVDLTGQRFGRLTVKGRHPESDKNGQVRWECVCDCSNIVVAISGNLRNGSTLSCGCLRKELRRESLRAFITTHGLSHLPEYRVWQGIKERCYNEKHLQYKDYGGCGITMCDEWKESFEAFYADMGQRPSSNHTIDRKENTKGYEPENCRWATRTEQANNRRDNLYYKFDGERKTLANWCRELSVDYDRVYYQLQKGLSFEDALDVCMKTHPAE